MIRTLNQNAIALKFTQLFPYLLDTGKTYTKQNFIMVYIIFF